MTKGGKRKLSVSLSSALVARIDEQASALRLPRSVVVEQWLEAGEERASERRLAEELERYYGTRGQADRAEDQAIASASSRAASRLEIDPAPPRRAPPSAHARSRRR